MKCRRASEASDDYVRLLALQPHQISGSVDPWTPIRALLGQQNTTEPRQGGKRDSAFLLQKKLADPEVSRLINERLAPAGLN